MSFCPVISHNFDRNRNKKPNTDKIWGRVNLEHVERRLCTTSNYSRLCNAQFSHKELQQPSVYEKKSLVPPARHLQRCQQRSTHVISIYPDVRAAVLQLSSCTRTQKKPIVAHHNIISVALIWKTRKETTKKWNETTWSSINIAACIKSVE